MTRLSRHRRQAHQRHHQRQRLQRRKPVEFGLLDPGGRAMTGTAWGFGPSVGRLSAPRPSCPRWCSIPFRTSSAGAGKSPAVTHRRRVTVQPRRRGEPLESFDSAEDRVRHPVSQLREAIRGSDQHGVYRGAIAAPARRGRSGPAVHRGTREVGSILSYPCGGSGKVRSAPRRARGSSPVQSVTSCTCHRMSGASAASWAWGCALRVGALPFFPPTQ